MRCGLTNSAELPAFPADNYNNGGQDWNEGANAVALCGSSDSQSPIDVPTSNT